MKGWDKESLRHSAAKKYGKAPPYRGKKKIATVSNKTSNENNDKEVAATILTQLGGKRFIVMTGAKNFVYSKDSLSFQIPRANNITHVKIELTPADLYDVEFGKIKHKTFDYIIIKKYSGVYWDNLQEIFTEATGLDTRLPTIIYQNKEKK